MSGARDGCTRVHSGAQVVHEITEWCTSTEQCMSMEWCMRKTLVDWAWVLLTGEDWRGGAVGDAGAEVTMPNLAEMSLLMYPGAGSP